MGIFYTEQSALSSQHSAFSIQHSAKTQTLKRRGSGGSRGNGGEKKILNFQI
jgi:hypothetical protein